MKLITLSLLLIILAAPVYAANPTVEEVDGIQAVTFNGVDTYLKSTFLTDQRYTSSNAWTVITKVYNLAVAANECMFNWGKRGGPAGTCGQQGYGNNTAAGAMAHWTAAKDMGFDGGVPAASTWHYIAATFPGNTNTNGTGIEVVWVDGATNAFEEKDLYIRTGDSMFLGVALHQNGNLEHWASLSIARLHVYDYALTEQEIIDISEESTETGSQPPLIRLEAEDLDDGELDFWDNIGTIGKGFGPLPLVTNVVATKGTYLNRISVTWNPYDDPGDKIYYIYRFVADVSQNAEIVGVVTNGTEYVDMDVELDATYYYWLKVDISRGMTEFSLGDSGYIQPRLYSPRGIAASYELYAAKVKVAWNPVGAASKYQLYRNTVNDAVTAADLSGEITVAMFEDTTAADPDQVYYYWVKAADSNDVWTTFSTVARGKLKTAEPVGWPMYSADPLNRGFNNGPNELSSAELVWSNGFKGYNLRSPVIDGDTIYLGCWPDDTAEDSTDLFAINLSDGSIKYRVDLPNPVYGGAAVIGDKVFVGEYGSAYDTHVYCIDKKTGTILWTRTLDIDYCTSAIKVYDGDLYFCSGSSLGMSSVRRIDAVTGMDVWRLYDQGLRPWYWGGNEPAISADGAWVVTRGESPHHIIGIVNASGDTNWVITAYLNPYPNQNPLFDSSGNAYSLVRDTGDGNVFRIVKIDPGSGVQTWKSAPLGDAATWATWEIYGQASPAMSIDESTIYVPHSRGATDGLLAVSTLTGAVKWRIAVTNLGHGEAPLVTGSGNMIMGVCGDKNADPFVIKAFGVKDNGINGSVMWTIPLPGPNDMDPFTADELQWGDWPSDTCPALTKDGNLVVTTRGGLLAYIRPPDSIPEVPGVDASDDLTDKIAVNWSASISADSYQLYRSQNPVDPNPSAVGGPVAVTSYDDTSVTVETPYYYWVKAHNTNGWSDYSPLDQGMQLLQAALSVSNVNFTIGSGTALAPYDYFSEASQPIEIRIVRLHVSGGNVYDLSVTRTSGSAAFTADTEAYINKDGSADLTFTYIPNASNDMFITTGFDVTASNIPATTIYVRDTPEPGLAGLLVLGLMMLARKLRG